MKHFSVHRLEREIAEVLKKGFIRGANGQPFDEADALQAGHDVAEFILGSYRIEEHPYSSSVPGCELEAVASGEMTVAEAFDHLSDKAGGLAKELARWAGITGEETRK